MERDDSILTLDRAGLRKFGLTTGAIIAVLFGLIFPWVLSVGSPWWPWWLGGVLAVWGLVNPQSLGSVYRIWMRLGLFLNRLTTPLILGAVFFLLFAPLAIVFRLIGRDTMARNLDDSLQSYRVTSRKQHREKMERPF